MGPLSSFFGTFGPQVLCCVCVCGVMWCGVMCCGVMWCSEMGWGGASEVYAFFTIKNAHLLNWMIVSVSGLPTGRQGVSKITSHKMVQSAITNNVFYPLKYPCDLMKFLLPNLPSS